MGATEYTDRSVLGDPLKFLSGSSISARNSAEIAKPATTYTGTTANIGNVCDYFSSAHKPV